MDGGADNDCDGDGDGMSNESTFGQNLAEAMREDARRSLPSRVTLPTTPTPRGWECPRCHTVHAPSVKQCGCEPKADG